MEDDPVCRSASRAGGLLGVRAALPPPGPEVARCRHLALELDRFAVPHVGLADAVRFGRLRAGRLVDHGERRRQPEREQLSLLVGDGLEALGRVTGSRAPRAVRASE